VAARADAPVSAWRAWRSAWRGMAQTRHRLLPRRRGLNGSNVTPRTPADRPVAPVSAFSEIWPPKSGSSTSEIDFEFYAKSRHLAVDKKLQSL
jgi:hypothetical protein